MNTLFAVVSFSLLNAYSSCFLSATNEGELTVSAGEELIVLERDIEDSGWTQVLKGDDEGYVPTSYIQLDE